MKTFKLDNGFKIKVFERKDIIEKLGRSKDDWKIISKYQKTFPELLQKHKPNDSIIDARTMWSKLGKPYDDFSHWVNRKWAKLFRENIDYRVYVHLSENLSGGKPTTDYKLTIHTAKHIAMLEHNTIGYDVRDYFILVEECLREIDYWILIREPEKKGWNMLRETLNSNYKLTHYGIEAPEYIYMNEADMINKCLFGKCAKEIRKLLNADDITRNHLSTEANKAIYELQILDNGLVMAAIPFEQRKDIVGKTCKARFIYITLEANQLYEEAMAVGV